MDTKKVLITGVKTSKFIRISLKISQNQSIFHQILVFFKGKSDQIFMKFSKIRNIHLCPGRAELSLCPGVTHLTRSQASECLCRDQRAHQDKRG